MPSDTITIDLSDSGPKLSLELTPGERDELVEARDHHDTPHMREKAAALLKIADGWSARAVALHGWLRTRQPQTVRRWLNTYRQDGFEALAVSDGRGRKPAFSPGLSD